MERYKKRTIALCLASLLTVVGAFGAENYDNSLMGLKINNSTEGYISITTYTQKPYASLLKTTRTDSNTYEITLEDTTNRIGIPDVSSCKNIKSIEIATTPLTTDRPGYTKITVKTIGRPVLKATTSLFIPDNFKNTPKAIPEKKPENRSYWDMHEKNPAPVENHVNPKPYPMQQTTSDNRTKPANTVRTVNPPVTNTTNDVQKAFVPPDYTKTQNSGGSFEYMTVSLCVSLLLLIMGIIFMLGRDKMNSVVGDQKDFDLDAINKQNKTKKNSIKRTINNLDQKYPSKTYSSSQDNTEEAVFKEVDEPETVIVDLDTLYQEKNQQTKNTSIDEEENDDLADFLNEFTFEENEEEVSEELFDEELFNKCINNQKLKFSQSDRQKINELTQIEIDAAFIDKLKKQAKENIVHAPTKTQRFEELISAYSINPSISFSKDDIKTLKKLMSVELDSNFIKDLSTNPERTKIVEKEIRESKPVKNSEILMLNVKDLLPDLSKELKKQGNKKIESEVKPDVVYFSEGYEYTKLSVSEDLSNIANALKTKDASKFQPSYVEPVVAKGYEVSTLSIKDELPDLADVKANPKKYEDKPDKKTKIDEKALLNSLSNVTFKPFYDEVQEEFNQFDNFEIINQEENIINPDNTIVREKPKERSELKIRQTKVNDDAQKLLKLIEEKNAERELKKMATEETILFKKELESAAKEKIQHEPFKYNGEEGEVIKSVQCTGNSKCLLVKHLEGYSVIGCIKNKTIELKKYDSLNNINIQTRLNDKNNPEQYIVKTGNHKFIIRITDENMELVMDLC